MTWAASFMHAVMTQRQVRLDAKLLAIKPTSFRTARGVANLVAGL